MPVLNKIRHITGFPQVIIETMALLPYTATRLFMMIRVFVFPKYLVDNLSTSMFVGGLNVSNRNDVESRVLQIAPDVLSTPDIGLYSGGFYDQKKNPGAMPIFGLSRISARTMDAIALLVGPKGIQPSLVSRFWMTVSGRMNASWLRCCATTAWLYWEELMTAFSG